MQLEWMRRPRSSAILARCANEIGNLRYHRTHQRMISPGSWRHLKGFDAVTGTSHPNQILIRFSQRYPFLRTTGVSTTHFSPVLSCSIVCDHCPPGCAILCSRQLAYMNLEKLAAVGALLAACGGGQTTFTVSSVKPNHSGKRGGDLSSSPVMLTIRNLPDIIIGPERPNVISCVDIGLLQAVDSELNPAKF
jgi:hypothetical protein